MLAILLMSKARDLLWKAQQSLQYVFLPMYTTKEQMHNLILIVQWWAYKGAKTPVTILAPGDYLLSAFLEKSFLCYLNECVLLGSFASQAAADILTVCLKANSSSRLWLTWIFPEVDFSCWRSQPNCPCSFASLRSTRPTVTWSLALLLYNIGK